MKENINEHDKTKQMMDIIRNGFKSTLITEADDMTAAPAAPNNTQPLEAGDDLPEEPEQEASVSDEVAPTQEDYNTELQQLREQINSSVEITEFKIFPNNRNVRLSGIFLKGDVIPNATDDRKYTGIYFTYNLNKGFEAPILNGVQGNDLVNQITDRIEGYYANFCDAWYLKLDEYKPKNN